MLQLPQPRPKPARRTRRPAFGRSTRLLAVVALALAGAGSAASGAQAAGGGGPDSQFNGSSGDGKIAVSVSLTGTAVGNGGTTSTGGSGGGGGVTTIYSPPACMWSSNNSYNSGQEMWKAYNDPQIARVFYVGGEASFLPGEAEINAHKDEPGTWFTIIPGANSNLVPSGSGYSWDSVTAACMDRQRAPLPPGASSQHAGYLWVPAGQQPPAPQPAPPTPEQLRDAAMAAMTLPVPVLGRNPGTTTLVYLPTWFWVPGTDFHTWDITASAGTPVVSATVVAQPQSMVVSSAGGSSNTCSPAQAVTAWGGGGSDASACTIEFQRSSVGQAGLTFTASGTTSYSTSWTSVVAGAAGPGGPLNPVSRTGQTLVPVAETQALVNDTR